MTTIATVHFSNGQWIETHIKPREEFDRFCEMESLPSVARVSFRTNDTSFRGRMVNGRPDVASL